MFASQTSRSEPQPNAAGASKRRIDAMRGLNRHLKSLGLSLMAPRGQGPSGSNFSKACSHTWAHLRHCRPRDDREQDPSDAVVHDSRKLVPSHEVSSGHQEDNEAHEPGSSALLHELDLFFYWMATMAHLEMTLVASTIHWVKKIPLALISYPWLMMSFMHFLSSWRWDRWSTSRTQVALEIQLGAAW